MVVGLDVTDDSAKVAAARLCFCSERMLGVGAKVTLAEELGTVGFSMAALEMIGTGAAGVARVGLMLEAVHGSAAAAANF